MITTSLPFGYLLIYGTLFFGILLGLYLCSRSILKKRFNWTFVIGFIIFVSSFGIIASDIYIDSQLEINPIIKSSSQIIGRWSSNSENLNLKENNQFEYQFEDKVIKGTWTLFDWNLKLNSSNFNKNMRVIKYGSDFRIMTRPPEDWDSWNGDLGLIRQEN